MVGPREARARTYPGLSPAASTSPFCFRARNRVPISSAVESMSTLLFAGKTRSHYLRGGARHPIQPRRRKPPHRNVNRTFHIPVHTQKERPLFQRARSRPVRRILVDWQKLHRIRDDVASGALV